MRNGSADLQDLPVAASLPEARTAHDDVLALLKRGLRPRSRDVDTGGVPQAEVGRLGGFDIDEAPLLESALWPSGELRRACTTVALESEWIGARVVFVLENGDARKPIVIGVIREPGSALHRGKAAPVASVSVDDQRIHLRAGREIVLECGAASITLTRAGKVIIKGVHVVSSSSGANRIKGAVIDIN